ncbi:hypothetical protein [Hoeflea alexandrii]|nr:hypothetical protein [Hoeflea alexandrii]MCZ4290365.1 hypothetical protein [Hoeflea alexandrii]
MRVSKTVLCVPSLYVSSPYSQLADVLAKLTAHPAIKQAKPLVFKVD